MILLHQNNRHYVRLNLSISKVVRNMQHFREHENEGMRSVE